MEPCEVGEAGAQTGDDPHTGRTHVDGGDGEVRTVGPQAGHHLPDITGPGHRLALAGGHGRVGGVAVVEEHDGLRVGPRLERGHVGQCGLEVVEAVDERQVEGRVTQDVRASLALEEGLAGRGHDPSARGPVADPGAGGGVHPDGDGAGAGEPEAVTVGHADLDVAPRPQVLVQPVEQGVVVGERRLGAGHLTAPPAASSRSAGTGGRPGRRGRRTRGSGARGAGRGEGG